MTNKKIKVTSHLEESLLVRYNVRSTFLYEHDLVVVMRGKYKGKVGLVTEINKKNGRVTINIKIGFFNKLKHDVELIKDIHHSNLKIIKLHFEKDRMEKLSKLSGSGSVDGI